MKEKKVVINYIFNTSYQLLALIVPLITTPYISRVLRPSGIGVYSYTYSIVCYFTLCAILGTATYGNKKIGILQDNPIERTKKFWDIFLLRFITSSIALGLYIIYVCLFSSNKEIAFIQSFYILGVMFDISWFFQGMEDFKRIAIRNYIIKDPSITPLEKYIEVNWALQILREFKVNRPDVFSRESNLEELMKNKEYFYSLKNKGRI